MNVWIPTTKQLPRSGQRVLCKYDSVYDCRVVTFWRDVDGFTHFGLSNEPDGKGSQPATHWAWLPSHEPEATR